LLLTCSERLDTIPVYPNGYPVYAVKAVCRNGGGKALGAAASDEGKEGNGNKELCPSESRCG
jgi:hypothetical protein